MIESKLIQVNKKKIVYIFVVTIKVVYLQCVKAITHADMINLYSVSVGLTIFVSVIARVVGY